MITILTVIFFIGLAYDIFLITPLGVFWIMTEIDDNSKPCYSIIIMWLSVLPILVIGSYLGYIK